MDDQQPTIGLVKPLGRAPNLWLKLTLAFLLVALLGVGLVALLANQVTTSGFRHYMIQGQLTEASELTEQLGEYYAEQGGWSGVASAT